MGPHWHAWPDAMRAAYARKFVEGLCEEDHKSNLVPTAERVIERSNWEDFAAKLLAADEEIGPRATRVRRVPQALCQTSEVPAAWPTQFAAAAGHPAKPHPAAANTAPNTVPMPTVGSASNPTPTGNNQWADFHGVPMSCSQIQGVPVQDESVARVKDGRCTHCLDAVPGGATHPDPCTNDVRCHHCLVEGHVKRECTDQPTAGAGQQQQQPARGGGGRGRGRGRGGFRPHNNPAPAAQPQPPAAEPVNQVSHMHQRFTGSQAVNSVNQQPDHRHASGRQPHRGHRQPRQHHQQPHRGQRSQNNKPRKNGTKPFPKLTRERVEIERVEKRLMQLANVVGAVVGDINKVIDWAGDQFKMRPIMGYPPLIGQVSQLAQGVQRLGGGGIADGPRNPPVPHHHHCGASGEREKSCVDNYAMYSSNKDYPTLLNGERDRGRWGVRHDAPHAPHQAVHNAWNEPPDPYYDETESHEYDDEGEGYDYQ